MAKSSKSRGAQKPSSQTSDAATGREPVEEAEIIEGAATPDMDKAADDTSDAGSVDDSPETEQAVDPDLDPGVDPTHEKASDDSGMEGAPEDHAGAGENPEADNSIAAAPEDKSGAEEAPEGETDPDLRGDTPLPAGSEDLAADEQKADTTDTADAAAAQVEPETLPVPPAAVPEEKKGGFMPLLLGGVLAGAIGYAVPTYLMPRESAAVTELQSEVTRLEADVADAQTRAMDAQAQAQSASDAAASIALPDLAPIEQATTDLAAQIEALDARLAALESRPVGESGVTEGELASLRALLEEQQAASADLAAEIERMAEVQAEGLANAETEALNAARAAKTEAALRVVRTAMGTGEPFEAVLGDLPELPDPVVSAAGSGVPTAQSLQDPFPDLARRALDAARSAAAEGDAAGSILAFVQKQVGARSVTPREGGDPDAVLSRAEAAVRQEDWSTALSELEGLPEAARAPLSDWIDAAETRAAALAALADFDAAN